MQRDEPELAGRPDHHLLGDPAEVDPGHRADERHLGDEVAQRGFGGRFEVGIVRFAIVAGADAVAVDAGGDRVQPATIVSHLLRTQPDWQRPL